MTKKAHTPYIQHQLDGRLVEAKIVRKIIKAFKDAGNPITEVFDGELYNPVDGKYDILELVFNLDEAYLIPDSGGWIRLVMGNEWELVCDYTVSHEDTLKPINDWISENW